MTVKLQIGCILILFVMMLLFFTSKPKMKKTHIYFLMTAFTMIAQIISDIVTVKTVNALETVSPMLNMIAHRIFFLLFMLSFYMLLNYFVELIAQQLETEFKNIRIFSTVLLVITAVFEMFLPFHYVVTPKGNYSMGSAAVAIYISAIIYVCIIAYILIKYSRILPRKTRMAIDISFVTFITIAAYQAVNPTALITSLGFTIMCLGCYLSVENPDSILAEQLQEEKLRADSANNAKTMFLARMSHEIRTPINAVLGSDEMILRESKEDNICEYAEDIKSAANSLLSIINDILDISKIEEGKLSIIPVTYDACSMLHDVINMINFKAESKNLELNCHIDSQLPAKLIGDDIRIRQILTNILNNAVKYTEKGSIDFTVNVSALTDDNVIITMSVKDTGIGIRQEDIDKICKPFERIEEKRNRNIEGTGLGMSITTQLLNMMDSKLLVESVYGEGSTFSFSIKQGIADKSPVGDFEGRIKRKSSAKVKQRHFIAPDARILMVDDNAMNRKVFANLVKCTQIHTDLCSGGEECLSKVRSIHYDIIFMDHMMPGMDGIETLHNMKKLDDYPCKETPVIILTANAIAGAKEMYFEEGFDGFLSKPVEPDKLEHIIINNLPDNKIQYVSDDETEIKKNDVSDSYTTIDLPVVDGVDYNVAKIHFDSKESMLETFEMFKHMLHSDKTELDGFLQEVREGTFDNYRIKVHSMKSSAMTLGIIPLAGMAKILEDAAKNNDAEVIVKIHDIFTDKWLSYAELLKAIVNESTDDKKLADDNKDVINNLKQDLRMAAEEMDIDKLDDIMNKLDEYIYPAEEAEYIDKLRKAVLDFDVEYIINGLR